ncbi:LPD5 domain-containing protein [Salmonella enterica subsp. enterica serovar Muenchen]|uniref:LPD38 domain-containing protein n=1 Tax=Salmonella enterica TaxID=28901 RepID=UPI001F0D84A1|nr:LPD38 domain-containing protein [Salmonella enterica]MCH5440339.1 LPD5 domain-containing protein [Salmonella enterica subsp. enterica serovar Muenchen]
MAYQPELMRPELQRDNGNRNGLNIQQPGEGNWRDGFFDDPENAVDHSKSFSLGDVLPTAGVGVAQSVQGTGELARGLGDALIHTPLKTSARIVNELSRMGLPGVATIEDIFSGAGKSADKTIDALPDGKNKVTDAVGKGLKTTGKGVSDVAGAAKDWSYDKMSPGAQRALNTPMNEGWDDPAVWVAKGTNLIGSIVPDLAAGGITKKVGEVALKKSLTGALEKKFLTAGLSPEKAAAYASESVSKAMPDLFQAGMVTSATASAQGSEAMNAADAVRNADYSELSKSPKFQQTFYAIDDDPQYAELSDRQKMDMAKERVADEVRAQLATDPQSLVVNALAAKLGDAQLVNLALRGTAKSVASGVARNVAEQAGINAAQGGFSRYQENAALRDTAGMDVPEWQGVGESAFESGTMGAALGAGPGAVAGFRGKRQAEAGAVARQDASRQAMDEKAQRAREMAQDSPYTKPADPVENYRQQFSGLSRDELLQHYADADLAHENDVDAVYRKHAVNGLLKEMDRADQLKGIVGEMQGKPRNEVLKEYRDLNEKDKRNATEQMRWEAAREVLKPQPKATEQLQPAQNTSAQNTARRPLYDADNLDVPAFMRDPRFRDFTDEPTEVQQHLTRGNAPTPEELVHEQMAKGDAGPTDYELAERPRLPSPGDIHPGQGYPMPGEVRHMSDEPPAGRGGRYTTTGEVQGQSYEKGRQSASPESVQRQGETFRGEQSYRELPAPEHQGLPRLEEAKSENAETVNTEEAQKASKVKVMQEADLKATREAEHSEAVTRKRQERLSSYLDTIDESRRDNVHDFLSQTLNNPDGRGVVRISDLVEKRVDEGWRIKKDNDGKPVRLAGPDGESLSAGDITRYGLEYAEHISKLNRKAAEKSGEKIDDFGEVIHGAAKHRRAALADNLNTDKTAEDYRTQPLSKLFPKPDYEKMAAEGTDNKTLAMLALLRNMIPAKPRVSHRLNRWAKQVEEVRDTAGQLLDGSLPADKFIDRISQEKGSHYREIVNTWEMLHRLSPAQIEQASGYRVRTHAYSMFGGKEYSPPKVVHTLENEKGRSVLDSEDLNDLHKKAKAYFDQQSASPKSADDKTKLDIYQHKRSGEMFIAYGKNKTVLQRGFKTVAEAREYTKTHRAELLEKLNALREQSREEQRNASNRDRNGPVRRGGEMHTDVNALRNISGSGTGYSEKAASLKRKIAARMNTNDAFAFNRLMDSRFADERERGIAIAERVAATLEPEQNVTPEKFSDAFGFRGVQFGNYVEGPRRQSDLNRAYDSLMDMADVLKIPPKALSLNGRLGLAFGARGKGGKNAAAAHYEPDQVAINLTKGNGAGSLAHEWFHALDNYFGQHDVARDGDVASGDRFMTARDTRGSLYQPEAYPVREEVYDAFMGVVKAVNNSGMRRRSLLLDEVRSKPYWSTDIEMAARAFERYVQDKAKAAGVENDYLVNIRKADDHSSPDTYAYPTEAELDGGIRQAFDKLFSTLKTRETDKGVAFYSRDGLERTPEGNVISQTGHSADAPAQGSTVRKVKTVARTVMDRIRDNDLNVRVVTSQAEAAELAGESLDNHGKVHAFYRPDEHEIVLVADNLPDGRTVREKLRHEIIHHALENVVTPAEYKTIVDNVLKTRDSNNATIKDIWRKVDASYGEESPQVQAGEFLAHMAEKHTPGKLGAAWNRIVTLVKAVLRRTGLLQPSDLNDIGYIRDTIRTLGQRVREGYVPRDGGEVSYSRTGKPDPFKVPEGEGERYRRDLEKAMLSKRSSDIYLDVGRTPPVLRHLGAPDLPVSISRDIIRKAINGVSHDVEMGTIEKLPELMHDPIAVYQSATQDNALVLWLNSVDSNGDPVLAAVHMNGGKKRLEINRIASVYGTEEGKKIVSMEKRGLALYRKGNPEEYRLRGLQLPVADGSQGSGKNILSPDDIRKGPYYSRSRSALSPEETLAARFVRQMQDKFQVLKAVQDKIRESGGKLDDSNDAYLAEELFHGKAENDLNVMKERYVKPLAKLLADYDIPQSALDEYLYARHAPERNAHIAKINPKMPDGGSGMTNAEAADIMDRVRRSGKQAQYDRLAGIVDDMLARRRELIKTAGLEKEGVVDAWQNAYKHYVPLKGQDADGTVPRTGRGYVISGKESKMAMGRNSRAQSPSTQAIQDLTESLIRNRKNEVGNAFLKLVQDNPDKDYWQVFTDDKPDTTRRIVEKNDPETGETIRQVEEMPVPMAMMSDRYFTTKKDGKTYYIKLHDERLMRAMKNMGPETGNVVIQTLARVNRFMSAMNTSLNPEFLVSNFVRDMQTAVMNLKAEQGRDDGKLSGRDIAMKTVRDSGIAMKAVYASQRGKSLTGKGADWQKTWKEFVEDGAKTGWFRMDDLNGQMKEMDRLVSLAKGGWKGQGIQSWHSFTKLVEDANNAVENALRLSAYKHARDAGISRAQAASLAKNMTVNFNRRGEQGVLLNSLYMFANASIQGTANMMRSLAHLNGDGPLLQRLRWSNLNMAQKMALTAVGAGYLLGSLNRAGAGQDEDSVNWYDKVPDYVKEHNLVIMKSLFGGKAGEYWSIPLPYGYNMFYLLGSTAEGVTRGNLTASKAAGNIVGGMLGAFNPLGSEDSKTLTGTLFKNAAPTILRPVADLWANENFMGTQIYQENFPGGTPKPESTLGRRSTPEAYKAFANWLNTSTGGSQYRSGALDINPDKMKYWIDYVSGGMGRFAGKTIDAAAKTYNGIDIPPQQIPFLGKISGKVMPYADQQAMYDHIDELRQYNAELKSLSGAGRAAFRNKYSGQLSMNGIIHQTEIQLKNLRKQRDEVYSDPTLTARQQADRVLMIEQNMKRVVDRFNREYREKVGE